MTEEKTRLKNILRRRIFMKECTFIPKILKVIQDKHKKAKGFPTSRSTSCSLGAPCLILFAQSLFLNFDVVAGLSAITEKKLDYAIRKKCASFERETRVSNQSFTFLRHSWAQCGPLAHARFFGTCSLLHVPESSILLEPINMLEKFVDK